MAKDDYRPWAGPERFPHGHPKLAGYNERGVPVYNDQLRAAANAAEIAGVSSAQFIAEATSDASAAGLDDNVQAPADSGAAVSLPDAPVLADGTVAPDGAETAGDASEAPASA